MACLLNTLYVFAQQVDVDVEEDERPAMHAALEGQLTPHMAPHAALNSGVRSRQEVLVPVDISPHQAECYKTLMAR